MATALRACNYTTGAVGKWHLSTGTGGSYSDSYAAQQAAVQAAGFDYADGIYISNLNTCTTACDGFTHNMEWITEKALAFMNGAITSGTPFLLYFNPTVPHTPLVREALDSTYSSYNANAVRGTPAGTLTSDPSFSPYCTGCTMASRSNVWAAATNTGFTGKSKSMAASVYWIDQAVGVIYDYLEEKNALSNTYIVVTSDNGDAKGTAYEQGVRCMQHVKGPGISAGKTVTDLVANYDLAPTVLEWAGARSQALQVDGVSRGVESRVIALYGW